jgi:thiamine pyrophosphokinase
VRALVFANGDPPSRELIAALKAGADLVVAADGGADKALALGVVPDAVVGDLDSASEAAREVIGADRFFRSSALDRTDLQKAIAFAIDRGCREVDVVAAGGGRADHALANLAVLTDSTSDILIRIVDDLFEVSRVQSGTVIDAPVGTLVSLVAIGQCTGVTTSGLRWELTGAPLAFSPLGIHNEVVSSPASVSVVSGILLLFLGRFIEKHQ